MQSHAYILMHTFWHIDWFYSYPGFWCKGANSCTRFIVLVSGFGDLFGSASLDLLPECDEWQGALAGALLQCFFDLFCIFLLFSLFSQERALDLLRLAESYKIVGASWRLKKPREASIGSHAGKRVQHLATGAMLSMWGRGGADWSCSKSASCACLESGAQSTFPAGQGHRWRRLGSDRIAAHNDTMERRLLVQ